MLSNEHRAQLKDIALQSIRHGLEHGKPLPVRASDFDPELRQAAATFVTLHRDRQLRGCIGMLKPVRPLVEDVAHNAYSAAFDDTRFRPMQPQELDDLDIHISVLGTPSPMNFTNEADLVSQLRPGRDGLILSDGYNRGTFLPSVWEQLASPAEFIRHLKLKAGLLPDYWSDSIEIQRYEVEEF